MIIVNAITLRQKCILLPVPLLYLPVSVLLIFILTYPKLCHLILQTLTLDLFLDVLQQLDLLMTAYWSRLVLQMTSYNHHRII